MSKNFYKKKIYIIQTRIPSYREFFFKNIKKNSYMRILSCKNKSDKIFKDKRFLYNLKLVNILGSFIWLKNIPYRKLKNNYLITNGNLRILNNYFFIILKYFFNFKLIWWGHLKSTRPAPFFDKIRLKIINLFADTMILYTKNEFYEAKKNKLFKIKFNYLGNTIDQRKIVNINTKTQIINKKTRFLFVGRLRIKPSTLVEEAIKIFSKIDKNTYKFTIIGSGDAKHKFQELVKFHNLSKNIEIFNSSYNEKFLSKYFYKSDFFLYPGYIGLSLVHAFYYSLPVITHNNRFMHAPEFSYFKNNYNGYSYEHKNFKSLEKTIYKALSTNKKKINQLRRNSKKTIKNLTIENMINRFNKIDFEKI